MDYRLISRILGFLLVLLGMAQSVCLVYSWLAGETEPGVDAVDSLGISTAAALVVGVGLMALGRRASREVLRKEAIAVVGLGWILCAAFGAVPFLLGDPRLGLADGFFESMSGFTTTGATVIPKPEEFPRGIILWRGLTQWLGGMGILVLFVALLSSFGVGGKVMFRHESSLKEHGAVSTRISELALRLWQIYLGLSLACFLGLTLLGVPLYDAICHTFTVVSTGGFSTHTQSIAYFDSVWIEAWLILIMALASLNFVLYAWVLQGRWDKWRQDEVTRMFFIVLAVVTVVVALDLAWVGRDRSLGHAFRVAVFQVVSIMSTTGYTTADFNAWPPLSAVLLLLLMAIGGCAGSTAGGVKLGRWVLFFKMARQQVVAAFRPGQVVHLQLNGSPVEDSLRVDVLFMIGIAGVTAFLGTVVVSLLQPQLDVDSCLSAVLATLFNIGPGLGQVGPIQNFSPLEPWTKVFLSLLMVLGRLEFYAILVLFFPSLWRKY